MSSSQPESAEITEDISVPTLSNRFRLLVSSRKLQRAQLTKSYLTRASGRSFGNLKGFVDLPLDIVFETAMYLRPKDLLELSRLSKQFRSIFASRSAIFVWRSVFRDIDMECFTDLNELQFASLLYDKHCMACGRTMSTKCQVFLMLRLRLCFSCESANLITIHALRDRYQSAWDLISQLPVTWAYCFKPEAQLLIEKFLSLNSENSAKFILNLQQHTNAKREATISISQYVTTTGRTTRTRTRRSCHGYGNRY